MHGRRVTIHSSGTVPVKKGVQTPKQRRMPESNSTDASTPRGLCFARAVARPAHSQKPNRTSHLSCERDQALPTTSKFRVARLLPASGNLEADSTLGGCARLRFTFPSQGEDKRRVHCQLRSLEEGSPSTTTSSFVCQTGPPHQDPSLGRRPSFTPTNLSRFCRVLGKEPSATHPDTMCPTDDGQGRTATSASTG